MHQELNIFQCLKQKFDFINCIYQNNKKRNSNNHSYSIARVHYQLKSDW